MPMPLPMPIHPAAPLVALACCALAVAWAVFVYRPDTRRRK